MRRDGARGNVDHRRGQLSGDLEHVRNHQQQPLRRRERRRQRAPLQRAVKRAGRAAFRLHLHDLGHNAPTVRSARRRPVVAVLGHRRRRRDRIDRDHLAQRVRHSCRGLVAIHALELLIHRSLPCRWILRRTAKVRRGSPSRPVSTVRRVHDERDRCRLGGAPSLPPRRRRLGLRPLRTTFCHGPELPRDGGRPGAHAHRLRLPLRRGAVARSRRRHRLRARPVLHRGPAPQVPSTAPAARVGAWLRPARVGGR